MSGKRPKSKARTAAQNSGEGMMAANMAELVGRWRKVHGRLADAVAMVVAAKAVAPAAACLIFRGREGFPLARHGFRPSLPLVSRQLSDYVLERGMEAFRLSETFPTTAKSAIKESMAQLCFRRTTQLSPWAIPMNVSVARPFDAGLSMALSRNDV